MGNTRCGFTLQKNVIILALIDLVCEIVGTALTCSSLVNVVHRATTLKRSREVPTPEEDKIYNEIVVAISTLTVFMAVYLVQIGLSILLLVGAYQQSKGKCRVWMHISAVILTIAVIVMILNSIFGSEEGNSIVALLPQIFLFVVKAYMIWTVYSYITKLRFSNVDDARVDYNYDQVTIQH